MFKFRDLFVSLKVRNYRLFFFGQSVSLIGTWVQRTTMSWLVYRLTGSPMLLGVVVFLSMIPSLFISPFAGAWADKWNRHHTLIATQSFFMLQAAFLAVGVLSGFINAERWWPLLALSLMQGVIQAFDSPFRQHFLLDLVNKRSLLPNAIASNSTVFNAARLIGPSIGGILIILVGEGICFAINAASYLAVIIAMLMIRITYPARQQSSQSTVQKILEGWKYAWQSFPIRFLIGNLCIFMLFAMSYAAVIPIFARDVLEGTAGTQGLLLSSAGVGALISSLYMAGRKSIKGLPVVAVSLACVASLALIGFAFSTSVVFSMVMMLIIGLGLTIQMSSTNILIQSVVDEKLRGRVLSVYTMSFHSLTPFGSLLIGFLAKQLGARLALALCAGVCLLWSLNALRLIPNLVNNILRMLVKNKSTDLYRPVPVNINYAELN
jgi:MFS family permease